MEQLSFDKFINTINKEAARDLVRAINVFMKSFRAKQPDAEADSKAVQDFLSTMSVAFANHPLWSGASREDLEAADEGLEKYLMTKLYDRTFAVDALDTERDTAVAARLQALQFVRPEHLEIAFDFASDSSLLLAQKELAKINMFKSPRDKLACVLSCCRVVNNLLASKKYGAGADDFTPVLIYVTIKAAPEALPSNLAFVERYRAQSKLVSEAQYFFVQMQSALAFIETLDVNSSLKVDPDELIAHMLAAGALSDADLALMQTTKRRSREQSLPVKPSATAATTNHQIQPPPRPQSTAAVDLLDLGSDPTQTLDTSTMVEVVDNFRPPQSFSNPAWGPAHHTGAPPPPPPPPPPGSQGIPYIPAPPGSHHHSRSASYDFFSTPTLPPPPPQPGYTPPNPYAPPPATRVTRRSPQLRQWLPAQHLAAPSAASRPQRLRVLTASTRGPTRSPQSHGVRPLPRPCAPSAPTCAPTSSGTKVSG